MWVIWFDESLRIKGLERSVGDKINVDQWAVLCSEGSQPQALDGAHVGTM